MFIHVPGPTPPPNCPGPRREKASRGRLRVSESLISKWLREGPGVAEGQLTGEGGSLVALLASHMPRSRALYLESVHGLPTLKSAHSPIS